MATLCSLRLHSFPSHSINSLPIELGFQLGFQNGQLNFNRRKFNQKHLILTSCCSNSSNSSSIGDNSDGNQLKFELNLKKSFVDFRQSVASLPPLVLVINRQSGVNLILGFCIATSCLVVAVRILVAQRSRDKRPGSVADLVRRGQLRSDRRGISKPLKYEDPFNNPLVKGGNGNSTVEMCGKVYRLAPVTLTEEQRAIHQKRRSRAYQWKRPKVFLKEGDSVPPDVDPDTVRWIPANHPFATTVNDIDEDLAQDNVNRKSGVPFRIQAEHDALQKKLEALQNEQKLNKLVIDPVNARDFERAFKTQSYPHERAEHNAHNGQVSKSKPPKSDEVPEILDGSAASAKDTEI